MVGFIIVTHGHVGQELYTCLEGILGVQENVAAVTVDFTKPVETARGEIEEAIQNVDKGDGVIIMTDMFGGTPSNISLSFLEMDERITFTAIIRDVTEHRQLERKLLQSERLAAVGQAAAHVAHEIKNPLMIIGGFSNQIRQRLEDEKDVQKLDMILEEVRRLEGLVANLGDFTKEYRLVKRPASINSVMKDVLEIMSGINWLFLRPW